MGSLALGEALHLNSYVGHNFVIKSNEKVIYFLFYNSS